MDDNVGFAPTEKTTFFVRTYFRSPPSHLMMTPPAAPPWQTGQQSPSPNLPAEKPTLSAEPALPGSVFRGFLWRISSTSPQALFAARRWPLLCSCQSGTSHLRLRARVHRLVPSSTSVSDRVSVGTRRLAVQGRARPPSSSPIFASVARRSDRTCNVRTAAARFPLLSR